MSIYYVYAYLREDSTPYYIGKGSGKRAYVKHGSINLPKDRSRIRLFMKHLTEEVAHALEVRFIAAFGRKDIGTGILRNMTDGGEGQSGWIPSEETKKKISDANKGEKHYMFGKTASPETKKKLSDALKGKTHSIETRQKMSDAKKGEKHPMFGRTHSEEARHKMSDANKGKKHPHSEETKKKLSDALKGKTHSPEHRQKLSDAKKGKKRGLYKRREMVLTKTVK